MHMELCHHTYYDVHGDLNFHNAEFHQKVKVEPFQGLSIYVG